MVNNCNGNQTKVRIGNIPESLAVMSEHVSSWIGSLQMGQGVVGGELKRTGSIGEEGSLFNITMSHFMNVGLTSKRWQIRVWNCTKMKVLTMQSGEFLHSNVHLLVYCS